MWHSFGRPALCELLKSYKWRPAASLPASEVVASSVEPHTVITGVEGDVRLTDGGHSDDPTAGVGVLEVFHAGAWGTVCNGVLVPFFRGLARRSLLEVSQVKVAIKCGDCVSLEIPLL